MLKTLEMTCFRRVEHAIMSFEPGITAIRGDNEAGKTTRLEAILYALFGSRSLRTPFADTVTYGHKESELKVSLEFGDVTFTRSAKGAEVVKDGKVFVTGQTEVTSFAQDLLGVDATTASKLMLATQGQLRGTLEQGPKATVELIEGLADFTLFDRLIEAMQHKLVLGSALPYEEMLKMYEGQLADFTLPEPPSKEDRDLRVKGCHDTVAKAKAVLEGTRVQEAEQRVKVLRDKHAAFIEVEGRKRNCIERIEEQTARRAVADAKAADMPSAADISSLEQRVEFASSNALRYKAWKLFSGYTVPATLWEGSVAEYDAEVQKVTKQLEDARAAAATASSDIKVAETKLITSSACGFCGKDVSQFPEVCQKNAALKATIVECETARHRALLSVDMALEELGALKEVARVAREQESLASKLHGYINFDISTYPPVMIWQGQPPSETTEDIGAVKAEMSRLLERRDAAIKAQAQVEMFDSDIRKLQGQLAKGNALNVESVSLEDLQKATAELDAAKESVATCEGVIEMQEMILRNVQIEYANAVDAYKVADHQHAMLRAQVGAVKANIDRLQFNNALLKKVRSARPLIADKLWTMVLATVSQMFSSMRGEKSAVSKGKDGFMVNGQAVASLSGSTLDLLGLALRVALTKTFLPTCPFLMLDEPGAAMDSNRVSHMLGFIASAEFNQVLLVTHEDVSSNIADSLMEI